MRNLAPAVLILAGCASGLTAHEEAARQAFEKWREAFVAGEADKVVAMMSSTMKSDWIFRLLQQGDPLVHEWRSRLEGQPRTLLDLWFFDCKKKPRERVPAVYPEVLRHPSFAQLCETIIKQNMEPVRGQFERLVVASVSSDMSGVTLLVRNFAGLTEIYQMVVEDGWKVDGHIEPRGLSR